MHVSRAKCVSSCFSASLRSFFYSSSLRLFRRGVCFRCTRGLLCMYISFFSPTHLASLSISFLDVVLFFPSFLLSFIQCLLFVIRLSLSHSFFFLSFLLSLPCVDFYEIRVDWKYWFCLDPLIYSEWRQRRLSISRRKK